MAVVETVAGAVVETETETVAEAARIHDGLSPRRRMAWERELWAMQPFRSAATLHSALQRNFGGWKGRDGADK